MTLPIQTYNQGFLKFGPMESCNYGDWMKSSDVYHYTRSLERVLSEARAQDVAELKTELDAIEDDLSTQENIYATRITALHRELDHWTEQYYKTLEANMLYAAAAVAFAALDLVLGWSLWLK